MLDIVAASKDAKDSGVQERPGMVHVRGGTFRMGSDKHYPEEAPSHRVTVDDFFIDRTPAARHAEAIETSTSHVGFRCVKRGASDAPN